MNQSFRSGRRSIFRWGLAATATMAAALDSRLASAQAGRGTRARAPLAQDADERRILDVLDDVHRRQQYLSVPEEDGRLLRVLVESIGAKHAVELGTSTGYSGLWLLLALHKTGGRLTSYEVDHSRQQVARENFERAGVAKLATLIQGDAHVEILHLKEPIDLLFIDADKEGYLDYLQKLAPRVRPGGLIAAHNMAFPVPDPRYVQAVTTNPAYETVFLNMHDAGIGLTLKKR
jgi:predicted O-methyltransferase YrrM